jgi:hypothetical protein
MTEYITGQEIYEAAKRIREDTIMEYTERKSIAVNYSLKVRHYQFNRSSRSVREDLFNSG